MSLWIFICVGVCGCGVVSCEMLVFLGVLRCGKFVGVDVGVFVGVDVYV